MLWAPTARLLVLQVAVLLLPEPMSATALHPASGAPPSAAKLTLPVGFVPFTVAVNVTLLPTVAGLRELVSVVVVVGNPLPAVPQASTSVRRDHESTAPVMLIRMRSVV